MTRLVVVVVSCACALVASCRGRDEPAPTPSAGSAGSSVRSAPPAGSAAVPDPWATPTTGSSVAETACPTVTAPYFFRIEKNGKTSYLLGTRHIGVAWRKMPRVVHEALANARLVVFETVDDDGSDDRPRPQAPAREQLGPALWARYRQLAGDALADSMESATPSEAMLMLMVTYEDRLSSLELEIEVDAREAHKSMKGLETSEFQQRLLEKYLDGRAARAFVENLDSLDELRQDTIEDLTEYCTGTDETPGVDAKERADMLHSGYTAAEVDAMDKEMLFDRNRSWIPTLDTMFAEGDVFVAVGADHTRGDQGVPALLTAKGYRVTRVTPVAPR